MSDLPRKNCWAIAEYAGDTTPDRMRRLLERASWDTMAAVRGFVTGQEKKGTATVGVKRQHVGCASRAWGLRNISAKSCAKRSRAPVPV